MVLTAGLYLIEDFKALEAASTGPAAATHPAKTGQTHSGPEVQNSACVQRG